MYGLKVERAYGETDELYSSRAVRCATSYSLTQFNQIISMYQVLVTAGVLYKASPVQLL